ncbi:MAG: 2-oxo acid dehydrogenase subunit E2 [Thermoanaerobaculales bacterium]|jgi:pyruvate dehydrogenase E2 component (dihydrolipoamide acetyltransferase)|nr:2-oxo acid dehydrogenase subunit E2 [Thermoanaerobaculales bacterium]
MTTTITIPELGEGVDSVDVVAVLVQVGDTIAVDQPLIEVETEKASVEVPSTAAGVVTEIHVEAGQSLGPAAPIVTLDAASASEVDPDHGEQLDVATTKVQRHEDDHEESAVPASRAQSEATAHSETASSAGDGDDAGEPRQPPASAPAPATATATATSPAPAAPSEAHHSAFSIQHSVRPLPAAPTVRRFAREVGMDLGEVEGSGPGGRISIDDVKLAVHRRLSGGAGSGPGLPAAELPDFSRWGAVRREPMSKIRRLTAEAMTRAWLTAPQVTHHELADVTELEELRRAYKERVEAAGGRLTMTAILVKIAAAALRRFPTLNASVDPAAGEIVFKDYVNIGVAVDTEHGLLVPVIKDALGKNIAAIAAELDDLASRARSRKLRPEEMQGGTFSISNLGGIGGAGFSPIVNWPEVAILGVSRGRIQPVWDDGLSDFVPRLILPLSLSYDHRLVDGAEAARFLRWVAEAIESPLLLALEG